MNEAMKAEYLETAHRLNEQVNQILSAVDVVLMIPDDTPLPPGYHKEIIERLASIIRLQRDTLIRSVERDFEISDAIDEITKTIDPNQ